MAGDDGTTTGVWFGDQDVDLLDEFDEEFIRDSRSEKIKDAMRLYLKVEQTLEEVGFTDMDEASKRHWVTQAMRHEALGRPGED